MSDGIESVGTLMQILRGKTPSKEEMDEIVRLEDEIGTITNYVSKVYEYFFKEDISHITNKFTKKKFNYAKMLQKIAKYHFNK